MNAAAQFRPAPWNKESWSVRKAPLKLRDIWAIRVRLQLGKKTRALALFNLAIDSTLRACDLVKLRVADVAHGGFISSRAWVAPRIAPDEQPPQRSQSADVRSSIRLAQLDLKLAHIDHITRPF
jgi:hypothetical protein